MIGSVRTARLLLFLSIFALLAEAGGPGFRTQHLLEEHFARYGKQFGAITQQQYLRYAQQLRDSRPGRNVLESRRPDGSGAKFDRRRGWFVSFDSDGTLRTFFIPNDGIRFFERQGRGAGPRQ